MATVDPMPYLPFAERGERVDGVFRWRLGVRPLDVADWFDFGSDAVGPEGWIAQKAQISADHHPSVFATLDDIDDEATEVAEAIVAHLTHHHVEQPATLDPTLHPLDAAARLVPADLVLMVERDGQMVCGGGSVCFPNRWDLPSKIGLTMAEVHGPVADLNAQLGDHVDRFLDRLTPERSYWRLGWGVIDVADGFAPPVDGQHPQTIAPAAEMFLRVERETLRRFPATHCVLFTIRTYVTPIDGLRDADARSALAASLDGMPDDIREYKGLTEHADAIIGHLRRTRNET